MHQHTRGFSKDAVDATPAADQKLYQRPQTVGSAKKSKMRFEIKKPIYQPATTTEELVEDACDDTGDDYHYGLVEYMERSPKFNAQSNTNYTGCSTAQQLLSRTGGAAP